ncbi:MAG: aminopeptidase P N-terminal domain-containing protein [Candidatus Obscuribacterales bacterium]|nr:aminopeptidase P N-terminal domain-containing protein [Candidatus Obscuribacterales bacterium]
MFKHKIFSGRTGPQLGQEEFASRRRTFFSRMRKNSVAVIVSNPEMVRSRDTEFPYRQSSDVLYLTGFPEQGSAVVLSNLDGVESFSLFVLPKDAVKETSTGIRFGEVGARKTFGADKAYPQTEFATILGKLIEDAEVVYYHFGTNSDFDDQFRTIWLAEQKPLYDPTDILEQLRHVKSQAEVEVIRYACQVSAMAHVEAMSLCVPGMFEYQLQAVIESVFGFNGLRANAYGSIVAGGNNATVLHYTTNAERLKQGSLVLVDAGGEYLGYASDITRTFPVSGKFSDAQKEIYELVLAAQLAAIRAARPGQSLERIHAIAANRLRRGLVKLGILPSEMSTARGARNAIRKAKSEGTIRKLPKLSDFFMHGTSHWMGLDVHDVPSDRSLRKDELVPGNIFTVEPGLYFRADDSRVPRKYRGIGIRIEDDVRVTADGYDVLTASVPKSIAEIESLMSGAKARLSQ